jgi:hypothetical protein
MQRLESPGVGRSMKRLVGPEQGYSVQVARGSYSKGGVCRCLVRAKVTVNYASVYLDLE